MKCAVIAQTQSENIIAPTSSCLLRKDVAAIAVSEGVPNRIASLRKHFGTADETAWIHKIRDRDLAEQLALTRFRPQMPAEWHANPRTWLSNVDIDNVIRQYENNLASSSRAFRYLGFAHSDFYKRSIRTGGKCISPTLCDLHVKEQVASGVLRIAIVFNLDVSTGPGTHWTACFIGLDPARPTRYGIFYYDSVGTRMKPGMRAFAKRLVAEVNDANFNIYENSRQKQRKHSECGIYATSFIILCVVTDVPFREICDSVMKDDDSMQRLRTMLYR